LSDIFSRAASAAQGLGRPREQAPVPQSLAEAGPAGVALGEELAVLVVVRHDGRGVRGATAGKDRGRQGLRLEVVRIAEPGSVGFDATVVADAFRTAVGTGDRLMRPAGRTSVFAPAAGPDAMPREGAQAWRKAYQALSDAVRWARAEADWQTGCQFGVALVGRFERKVVALAPEAAARYGYDHFTQLELVGVLAVDAYRLERKPATAQPAPEAPVTTPAPAAARRRTRRPIGAQEDA